MFCCTCPTSGRLGGRLATITPSCEYLSFIITDSLRWWASHSFAHSYSDMPTSVVMNAICVYNNFRTGLLDGGPKGPLMQPTLWTPTRAQTKSCRPSDPVEVDRNRYKLWTVWNVFERRVKTRSHQQATRTVNCLFDLTKFICFFL